MFWSKNSHFSNFSFLGNIRQENVFYDILEPKNAFRGYKNKKFKKSKNWHFSKGVNPWFWSKNGHFSNFVFFRQYSPGKCLLWYSKTEKTLFKAIKTRSSKSRKTDIFLKGLTDGLGLNIAIFPTFFLGKIGQENVFYDILERKNAFSGFKNKKSKKNKNWHFSKGVNPWFWSADGHFSNFLF